MIAGKHVERTWSHCAGNSYLFTGKCNFQRNFRAVFANRTSRDTTFRSSSINVIAIWNGFGSLCECFHCRCYLRFLECVAWYWGSLTLLGVFGGYCKVLEAVGAFWWRCSWTLEALGSSLSFLEALLCSWKLLMFIRGSWSFLWFHT